MNKFTRKLLLLGTASILSLSSCKSDKEDEQNSVAVDIPTKNVRKKVRDVLVHYSDTTYVYKNIPYEEGYYLEYGTSGMKEPGRVSSGIWAFESPDGKTHLGAEIELGEVREKGD